MRAVSLAGLLFVAAVVCFFLFRPVPTGAPGQPDGDKHRVVVAATIFPVADWLRAVGGPDVHVHCLVSGAQDPHEYQPSISDAARVTEARALFAVGLDLDPWAAALAKNSGRGDDLKYFATGDWITPRAFGGVKTIEVHDHEAPGGSHHHHNHEHSTEGKDPHYWHDPTRAITVVRRMAEELGKIDPERKDAYAKRAETYIAELTALDGEIAAAAKLIPKGKQVVTFHDAYGYILERLGIGLAAVVQVSPGMQPGISEWVDAIAAMKKVGQRVIFKETTTPEKVLPDLAKELNATIATLDSMDIEASTTGKTYVERMRHNIKTLVDAVK